MGTEDTQPKRQPSFYRSPSNDYEEGYRDGTKDIASLREQLKQKEEVIRELTGGLESVIRLKPLIEYTGMPEEKHIGEAMAISTMLSKVESLIEKAKLLAK